MGVPVPLEVTLTGLPLAVPCILPLSLAVVPGQREKARLSKKNV